MKFQQQASVVDPRDVIGVVGVACVVRGAYLASAALGWSVAGVLLLLLWGVPILIRARGAK